MKTPLLLPVIALAFSPLLQAADAPGAKPAAAAGVVDFSSFKTADEFWKHIEKLKEEPKEQPKSRDEAMQMVSEWLTKQQQAADAFVKAFPQDARRWQAAMLSVRTTAQLRRFTGKVLDLEGDKKRIDEILNAPDAPAAVKGEAAFMGVMLATAGIKPGQAETFAPFYKGAAEYLEKYPDHPLAAQLKQIQLQVLNEDTSPEADAQLKKLVEGSDARSAEAAKGLLEKRQKMADLKSKPVDIKFTSTDGKEVDLAKMRGKVVLVDFWASWCGPCIGEMPNVVSTYKKLHDKGFEIVGISLDQDKEAMEGALKKHEMTWVQYFDGGGWENKISKSFGIQSIPAAWLIDKKGMLREMGLRGDALGAGVEKLLAE
jgi:thiol-disulfide isomerase/thioredoxin